MKILNSFLNRHSLVSGMILMILLTCLIALANSGVIPYQVPVVLLVFILTGLVDLSRSAPEQILEDHSSFGIETMFLLGKSK